MCGVALPAASQTRAPISVRHADDFYVVDGKPVPLDRATSECVVGVATDVDLPLFVQSLPVRVRAGEPLLVKGRRFVPLTLEGAQAADDLARLLAAVRRRPEVWFVSPIYYQPATRVRVIPTDDLIVKLASPLMSRSLSDLLKASGLQQISLIEGAPDQYVLRIVPGRDADVLRVARELYASGLFQWVEPDFLQELRR